MKQTPIKPILYTKNTGSGLNGYYCAKPLKKRLENVVENIHSSFVFELFGISENKSWLLYGPPGTGKTYAVQKVCEELSCLLQPELREVTKKNKIGNKVTELSKEPMPEYPICFMEYSIGRYGTAYINEGAKNLQSFFDVGRAMLNNNQYNIAATIYYFDECDAIMGARGKGHKEDDKLLETLMTNLQNINNDGTKEYIFMSTNFPDILDDASIRSGRVNEKIKFELPDEYARELLFRSFVKEIKEKALYQPFGRLDYDLLVEHSAGKNIPDIKTSLESAIRYKILNAPENVNYERLKVRTDDIIKCLNGQFKTRKKSIGFL
jgi:ATP-dependent 26S proteasome regulatory subunit